MHQIQKAPKPLQSQCAALQASVCLCEAPACTASQAPNACSSRLPKSFKKTNTEKKKLKDRERLRGKRGQSSNGREVIFFPSSLLLLFSHHPPYLFLCLSPSPLLPLLLSVSVSLVLTVE